MVQPPDSAVAFVVNGTDVSVSAPPQTSLLSVLRQRLGLCGTRFGCGEGQCGACTVLVDGRPLQSCQEPLWSMAGRSVTTVEGLGQDGQPGPVQRAFLDLQAAQCGYCTNGIMMTVAGLLAQDPLPSRQTLLDALDARHLCRCGAHPRILRAVDRLLAEAAA